MFTVFVRGKKDRDAVLAAIKTFYPGWNIEVKTFKGSREEEKVRYMLEAEKRDKLVVVLLGREDYKFYELRRDFEPNVVFYKLKYNKVRNARTIVIARALERARAVFRLGASWTDTYIFDHRLGGQLVGDKHPGMDFFFMNYDKARENLKKLTGVSFIFPLLLRGFSGEHEVFDCGKLKAVLLFPDFGDPRLVEIKEESVTCNVDLDKMIRKNRYILDFLVRDASKLLSSVEGKVDEIIVPLSGGKDSSVAAILAVDVYGKDRVKTVYVDTGVDFPENRIYAEELSRKLGIDLAVIRAPVKENIGVRGLPTHENRWCTALKIQALHNWIREQANSRKIAVVVGDRDAESRTRSIRPPLRHENGWVVLAPLKLWGTNHIQMFLWLRKIKINPLYEAGFYRTGCFVCPSLRSWELFVLKNSSFLERIYKVEPEITEMFLRHKEVKHS